MPTNSETKRNTGGKSTPRRSAGVILLTLVLAWSSFAGCATKPDLSRSPDGRACLVSIIDSTEAILLRVKNQGVKAGDVVMTPWCAEQYGEDLTNDVYYLTR